MFGVVAEKAGESEKVMGKVVVEKGSECSPGWYSIEGILPNAMLQLLTLFP
jgi:hypothetical protein